MSLVSVQAKSVMVVEVTAPAWLHRFIIGKKGQNIGRITQQLPRVRREQERGGGEERDHLSQKPELTQKSNILLLQHDRSGRECVMLGLVKRDQKKLNSVCEDLLQEVKKHEQLPAKKQQQHGRKCVLINCDTEENQHEVKHEKQLLEQVVFICVCVCVCVCRFTSSLQTVRSASVWRGQRRRWSRLRPRYRRSSRTWSVLTHTQLH